jgi:hypothetical protein
MANTERRLREEKKKAKRETKAEKKQQRTLVKFNVNEVRVVGHIDLPKDES